MRKRKTRKTRKTRKIYRGGTYTNTRGASVGYRISREPGPESRSGRSTTMSLQQKQEIRELTGRLEDATKKALAALEDATKKALAAKATAKKAEKGSETQQKLYDIAYKAVEQEKDASTELFRRQMALENQLEQKKKVEAEKNRRKRAEELNKSVREDWQNMSLEEKKKYLGEWKSMSPEQKSEVAQNRFQEFKQQAISIAKTEGKLEGKLVDRAANETKILRDSMKKEGKKLLKLIITKNTEELNELVDCSNVAAWDDQINSYIETNYEHLLEKYSLEPTEKAGAAGESKEDVELYNQWNGIFEGVTNKLVEKISADTGADLAQSAIEDPKGNLINYAFDFLYGAGKVALLAAVVGGGKYNKSSKTKKKTRRRARSYKRRRTRVRSYKRRRTRGRSHKRRRTRGRGRTRQRK